MALARERARLGNAIRHHPEDTEAITTARLDLAAAKLEAHIRKVVDAAPPLTDEQRDRLALLLRPAERDSAP